MKATCPNGLRVTSGIGILSLCTTLAILHQVPHRAFYRCQIAGTLLEKCCCKINTTAGGHQPSCCNLDQDPQENLTVDHDDITSDACGCCTLSYRAGTQPFVRGNERGRSTARGHSALLYRPSSAPSVLISDFRAHCTLSNHRPRPKAPLYLLHSSPLS